VNPRGEFHVENVTNFEETPVDTEADVEPMVVDTENEATAAQPVDLSAEGPAGKAVQVNVEGVPMDGIKLDTPAKDEAAKTMDTNTLYPIFWTLQQAFSDPTRLFADEHFNSFKRGMEATLAKFKEVPKVNSAKAETKRGFTRPEHGASDDFANTFNPKYLTSRDLFKLEVRKAASSPPNAGSILTVP
jgi:THO complex subunit 1